MQIPAYIPRSLPHPPTGIRYEWLARMPAYVLIALLAASYYIAIGRLAVNLPWLDDYVQFLGMYVRLGADYSLHDLFAMMFEQPRWNDLIKTDHRLVFARAVMVLCNSVCGEVNFRWLTLIGNAFVAITFILLWRLAPADRWRSWVMLPVAVLMFSLAHREAAIWSSAALLYYPAACFALLAMGLTQRGAWGQAGGATASGLSAMAQSNGLLAFPIVALAHFSVSRRRAALLFALLTLLAFALYFTDYSRPLRTPHYVSTWHAIKATLVGWLQLQGNILPSLALPIGVFTTLAWVYLAARGYWRRNPVLFWFGVWALATLGTVSLGRANYGDEFVVTQVRYRYYGIVFLAVTYLALMEHLCSKPLRAGLWLLLGVASVQVYITEASLGWGWVRKTLADGKVAANYLRLEGRAPEESLWFPKVHDVAPILGYAERAGLWRLPAFPAYIGQATAPARAAQVAWLPMTLDRPLLGRRSLGVSGSLNLPLGASCSESATLVWLEHAGRRHYYNAERFARADKVEFFRRPCRAFATLIDTAALAPGEYRVGVAVSERGRVVAEQAAPWRASLNAGAAP